MLLQNHLHSLALLLEQRAAFVWPALILKTDKIIILMKENLFWEL